MKNIIAKFLISGLILTGSAYARSPNAGFDFEPAESTRVNELVEFLDQICPEVEAFDKAYNAMAEKIVMIYEQLSRGEDYDIEIQREAYQDAQEALQRLEEIYSTGESYRHSSNLIAKNLAKASVKFANLFRPIIRFYIEFLESPESVVKEALKNDNSLDQLEKLKNKQLRFYETLKKFKSPSKA